MKKIFAVFLSILVLPISGVSYADVFLSDMNSTMSIDPTTPSGTGAYAWTVNGTNQLFQQWFWYRVGSTGPEAPINTISAPTVTQLSPEVARIVYSNSTLSVSVLYSLTGGTAGSLNSDVAETIRIINNSGGSLDLHFFQYSDFDLNGTPGDDQASLLAPGRVVQYEAGSVLSETAVVRVPDEYEIDFYPNILNRLNDGSPTTLSGTKASGPGDMSWAFEWDQTIDAGGSFIISKDKNLRPVPEPLSLILLGCGMVGLIELKRRIKK